MWDKLVRLSVFTAIYDKLFWEDYDALETRAVDWSFIFENLPPESNLDASNLNSYIEYFDKKKEEYQEVLSKYLKNWDRTFLIIKACLYTYLIERDLVLDSEANKQEFLKALVTRYIRLSENYVGGQNVGLVHAVMSKINNDSEVKKQLKN
ncbi:MAG: hypothetical protein AAGF07_00770 [Patescibacteria group bacterium]